MPSAALLLHLQSSTSSAGPATARPSNSSPLSAFRSLAADLGRCLPLGLA
jgi:hypothetical protein